MKWIFSIAACLLVIIPGCTKGAKDMTVQELKAKPTSEFVDLVKELPKEEYDLLFEGIIRSIRQNDSTFQKRNVGEFIAEQRAINEKEKKK